MFEYVDDMSKLQQTNRFGSPLGLKCIMDVSYGVALLFGVRGGRWTGWGVAGVDFDGWPKLGMGWMWGGKILRIY